jgi:flavin-dependent dehydrogenase
MGRRGDRVRASPYSLDKILVDAAGESGAEVREAFPVEDVVIEDDAVVGIHGHSEGGTSTFERARIVIGADGRNSRIGRAVAADEYDAKPMLQWSYYT